MSKELYMVILPAISWFLFALGGTQISNTIPGWKGWRRFVLPIVYIIACITASVPLWRAFVVGVMALVAFSLGYGENTSWKGKILVGITYGLISLPVGLSIWNLFTAIGFIVMFLLSNLKLTSRTFIWKICEGSFGALVGIQIAYKLMGF